jgi:hypothetical protein
MSSLPPLKEVRVITRQDSRRRLLVCLQPDTSCSPSVHPQAFDGVREPFVKGKRAEAWVILSVFSLVPFAQVQEDWAAAPP